MDLIDFFRENNINPKIFIKIPLQTNYTILYNHDFWQVVKVTKRFHPCNSRLATHLEYIYGLTPDCILELTEEQYREIYRYSMDIEMCNLYSDPQFRKDFIDKSRASWIETIGLVAKYIF